MEDLFAKQMADAYAELNIYAQNLDGKYISSLLGLDIEHTRCKNEYFLPEGKCVVYNPARNYGEIGLWTYKTEMKPTCYVHERMGELMNVFESKITVLNRIQKECVDCELDVCIVIYSNQNTLPGVSLTSEQIDFMSKIDASFSIDLY